MGSETHSVFFHNYYGNDQEWIAFFLKEFQAPLNLFYNTVAGSYYRLKTPGLLNGQFSSTPFPDRFRVITRETPNKGKDIGGKLILFDAYLRMNPQSDYLLLLHDKRSPYHFNSEEWKKDLFRIAAQENQKQVFDLFNKYSNTGIVTSHGAIRNELDNDRKTGTYINSPAINILKEKYNIKPPDLQYVAGTMFWVRASLMEGFFSTHSPLYIRSQLEEGNVTDEYGTTQTHAWERLLSWIITSQGYEIRGI